MEQKRDRVPLAVAMGLALVGSVLLVVVALPRFGALSEAPNPTLFSYELADGTVVEGLSVDMREYLHAVEHFSGDADAPDVAPFTRRVGITWLAGQLPYSAPVALNVVVLAVLCAGLFALMAALRRLTLPTPILAAAAGVYAVAFPVFYWGSFNFVDGAVVGILAVLMYCLVTARPGLALVALAAGVVTKESALVGLVAMLVWVWTSSTRTATRWAWTAGAVGAAVLGFVVAELLGPTATTTYNPWLPSPSEMYGYMGNNVRITILAQVVLTLALPVAGLVLATRRRAELSARYPTQLLAMLWAGVAAAALLGLQAFMTAHFDGRTVWTAYPFALTLGAMALDDVLSQRRAASAGDADGTSGQPTAGTRPS